MPLGPWELAIILVIVIIIFGAGKLPEIGGALGRGIKEFKQSTKEDEEFEQEEQQQYGQAQYPQQPQYQPAQQYHAEQQPQEQSAEQSGGGEPARKDV